MMPINHPEVIITVNDSCNDCCGCLPWRKKKPVLNTATSVSQVYPIESTEQKVNRIQQEKLQSLKEPSLPAR